MTKLIRLAKRAVVRIEGPDVVDFLQGIITNTLSGMENGEARYAGLLTPQGKLLFDFFLVKQRNYFLVELDSSLLADFVKRLTFYKLRAKVEICPLSEAIVGTAPTATNVELKGAIIYQDPRLPDVGMRLIVLEPSKVDISGLVEGEGRWREHRIRFGLPEGGVDYVYGDCFPHDIAMDQLNGIAFNKGCYVGQEVVSRMRHRGTARKRPMIVVSSSNLPPAPLTLYADTISAGEVTTVSDKLGLTIVRLDRVGSALAEGKTLRADASEVRLCRPAFAAYGEEFEPFEG